MRKSDKKLDNDIRKVLTSICEQEFESVDGFVWLTHSVNYADFPDSLKIICVFDTDEKVKQFVSSDNKVRVISVIQSALGRLNIKLKKPDKHIMFDSEQHCEKENNGNWAARLATVK